MADMNAGTTIDTDVLHLFLGITWLERSAIVLFLLLLVSYFTNLIRYCLRLATFYNGWRNALRLVLMSNNTAPLPDSIEELAMMMWVLSPDNVDLKSTNSSGAYNAFRIYQEARKKGSR